MCLPPYVGPSCWVQVDQLVGLWLDGLSRAAARCADGPLPLHGHTSRGIRLGRGVLFDSLLAASAGSQGTQQRHEKDCQSEAMPNS